MLQANVERAQDVATQFGVASLPTLLMLRDGKEVGRTVGAQPKDAIVKQLEAVLD